MARTEGDATTIWDGISEEIRGHFLENGMFRFSHTNQTLIGLVRDNKEAFLRQAEQQKIAADAAQVLINAVQIALFRESHATEAAETRDVIYRIRLADVEYGMDSDLTLEELEYTIRCGFGCMSVYGQIEIDEGIEDEDVPSTGVFTCIGYSWYDWSSLSDESVVSRLRTFIPFDNLHLANPLECAPSTSFRGGPLATGGILASSDLTRAVFDYLDYFNLVFDVFTNRALDPSLELYSEPHFDFIRWAWSRNTHLNFCLAQQIRRNMKFPTFCQQAMLRPLPLSQLAGDEFLHCCLYDICMPPTRRFSSKLVMSCLQNDACVLWTVYDVRMSKPYDLDCGGNEDDEELFVKLYFLVQASRSSLEDIHKFVLEEAAAVTRRRESMQVVPRENIIWVNVKRVFVQSAPRVVETKFITMGTRRKAKFEKLCADANASLAESFGTNMVPDLSMQYWMSRTTFPTDEEVGFYYSNEAGRIS